MLGAAEAINEYTAGLTVEAFAADRRTVDAVMRNIQVLGEAARHVPDEVRARFPEVPWQDISDMRNVLVHEYFGVDLDILWQTVTRDLALLVPLLLAIVDEASE